MASRSLPPVGAPGPFHPPVFREDRLTGGLRVWSVSHSRAPVLTLKLLVPVGSAADPPDAHGLAALTADLLDEGTATRTDVELHEALTSLGGHLAISTSADATVLTLTTLPRHAAAALALLVEVATRPRFAPADVERVRDLRATRIRQMRQVPGAVANRVFCEVVYGGHAYGHLSIGSEASLAAIDREQVVRFHEREYAASRWTVVVAGDVTPEQLHEIAEPVLAPLSAAAPTLPDPSPAPPPDPMGPRVVFVPRPGAVQSEIRLGHIGPARRSPEYHPLVLLNTILGGQFTSRVNLNLREDKGYTYGARTAFDWRRGPGTFALVTSVQTESTVEAVSEALTEIAAIRDVRPVTEVEVAEARTALTLGFPRGFETASQIARVGTHLALHDLAVDEPARFAGRMAALDVPGVTEAAVRHLHPDRLLAVLVGSAEAVLPRLASLGLGEPEVVG